MKVKNLYIISVEPDNQIKGSTRGFLYKYMLNNNAENIFVYEFNAESAIALLKTKAQKEEGGAWTLESGPATESNSSEAQSTKPEKNSLEEYISDINDHQTLSTKKYKPAHQNGAIIACHASSMSLCSLEPEIFAQNLIACTAYVGNEAKGVFPIFDKIVFNACRAAKHFEKSKDITEGTNLWEAKQIKGSKKNQKINVAIFKQNGIDNSGELTESPLIESIELSKKYFNPIYRFLNIYGNRFNNNIIVAGYDEALTAADMSKEIVDQKNLGEIDRLKASGRKMLLENASTKPLKWIPKEHKFFYKFTTQKGNITATLVPIKWSEWTDQITD
ncbi:hypothetical protein [Metapseudomonas otitidis]|uniref:hypothetical protein n=1 Tax=Metapseudomonas otitidis TaxID=319939 RepID=UPI0013F6329E|nr:hypothetical protein [Pseudomonas otitidis]